MTTAMRVLLLVVVVAAIAAGVWCGVWVWEAVTEPEPVAALAGAPLRPPGAQSL